jgi:hypothetical protein
MFTDIPLVCIDNPGKNSSPAMWSSAKGGQRGRPDSGEAGGRDGRGKAGEGSRATGFDLCAHLRRKPCRWAGAAEAGGGRRWGYDSGDERGGAGQLVSVLALL